MPHRLPESPARLAMIPLVDTHCHLLAGLDDGPSTADDTLEMCRIVWEEGVRAVAATVHMGEQWPRVTPDRIRSFTEQLASRLRRLQVPLTVYPCAEVMVRPDLKDLWIRGELLSVSDRGAYLLMELPAGLFLDLREMVFRLTELGIHPILAHPERHPELLHDAGVIEQLIRLGCLVQISSDCITGPLRREDLQALKGWLRRGVVHLVGSDGHSPTYRPPRMAEAYRYITLWAGAGLADRICSTNGLAVLRGLPLRVPKPELPNKRSWFSLFR